MTTLKAGIASYEEMKARTMQIARGEHRVAPGAVRSGLLEQVHDRLLQPVAGAIGPDVYFHDRWEALENRAAQKRIKGQVPADEARDRAPTAGLHGREVPGRNPLE